jgi:two-component system, NarL family, response regulator NreC
MSSSTMTSSDSPSSSTPRSGQTGTGPISIVLADDHQVVRSGLRVLLDSDRRFDVVGESGDVAGTIHTVQTLRPRVLVLDLNMGGESSLEAIPRLREDAPGTQIVVLTMQENPGFAQAALRAGAVGYVLKDAADGELMNAVVLAAEGRTYLNPELGARLAAQPPESDGRPDNLSPREVEVLTLIALGHTNGEIATSLFLSVRTVESHRAHIQQKVGLTSRAELVSYASDRGLLD